AAVGVLAAYRGAAAYRVAAATCSRGSRTGLWAMSAVPISTGVTSTAPTSIGRTSIEAISTALMSIVMSPTPIEMSMSTGTSTSTADGTVGIGMITTGVWVHLLPALLSALQP